MIFLLKPLNNVLNSFLNYHVTLNIMSCDFGGHDHTPEWLVINIWKVQESEITGIQAVRWYRFFNFHWKKSFVIILILLLLRLVLLLQLLLLLVWYWLYSGAHVQWVSICILTCVIIFFQNLFQIYLLWNSTPFLFTPLKFTSSIK